MQFTLTDKLNKKIKLAKLNNAQSELYDELVKTLIRQQYNSDKVEAIINNYLDEPNEKHTAEFQELQIYRKECKAYAKEVLGLGGNNND